MEGNSSVAPDYRTALFSTIVTNHMKLFSFKLIKIENSLQVH